VLRLIRNRRSERDFSARAASSTALGSVLSTIAAKAVTAGPPDLTEVGVVVHAVSDVPPGAYRYRADSHALEPLRRGALARKLRRAALGQEFVGQAAFVIVFAMRTDRAGRWWGARDYRLALLDAGLRGEIGYLAANAHQLSACGVGAFHDAELARLLAAHRQQWAPLYLIAVGTR
jgi:SagB-type dehydrogenase family enzyme